MFFDVVRGRISNPEATKQLINKLTNVCEKNHIEGTLYAGYPLPATADSKVTLDALFVNKAYGLIIFSFSDSENEDIITNQQDELYYQLTNNLTKYQSLRKGRGLAFNPIIVTLLPTIPKDIELEKEYIVSTVDQLEETLGSLEIFDSQYYRVLTEALQKVAAIKPQKKRNNVSIEGSKGDIIKKIEKEINNLDRWQKKAAFELTEGPQRIRGLAGSGKTIVLALKAAYLHCEYPDWDIVVTYYTRALWQQYRDLIYKFVMEFSGDEPNWDKIHVYHSWGSPSEEGVYSIMAKQINITPVNYLNATAKYGRNEAFSGICAELTRWIPDDFKPTYDAFLIDEAQDMPASFFKLAYKATKMPKRIIWAYDELQNLSSSTMPGLEEMFGADKDGKPLIQLESKQNEAQKDIILPVCYRNPPWALSLAHSLGFGIYRNPLVQHFEELGLWEEIGYKVEKGTLKYGNNISLARKSDSTPAYFSQYLNPLDAIVIQKFDDVDMQYKWIAEEIQKNINNDELDPDDILVIFPNVITAKNEYRKFIKHLNRLEIPSILTGVTNDRDTFRVAGSISCAHIYRAKGNESPMVYLANADYCFSGFELIKLRNTLFTAITRSQSWIRICGIGSPMEGIIEEIESLTNNNYTLDFKIPTKAEMAKLRTIHRERTDAETKKLEEASKGIKTLLDLANSGELDANMLPGFESLMQLYMKKKMSKTDEEDE